MREWDARRVAQAAGAELIGGGEQAAGPGGVSIDSRTLARDELFIGLRGERADGGEHAAAALAAGAWGVLVAPEQAYALGSAPASAGGHARAPGAASGVIPGAPGVVLAHKDPLAALQALARAWRRELGTRGAKVVAITGSTGKTSTKDILAALLASAARVAATPANLNTEIGLPLTVLAAAADTQVLVLELAMRGAGQIAELTAIAEPDVGMIVNVGPAHLELLGSLAAIAAAKAELIAGLGAGASAVVPAREPLLAGHLRSDVQTITFGDGGEVCLAARRADGAVVIEHAGEQIELWPSFSQAHNVRNLVAAVAAARALGYTPEGSIEVRFTAMRGEREALSGGAVLIDDCYNANPMSMRAAIDELVASESERRVAVLGDMLELGAEAGALHREIGAYAREAGVDVLVSVGPLAGAMRAAFAGESHGVDDAEQAAELVAGMVRGGDTVLVKGSRGVRLERVSERLRGAGGLTARTGEEQSGDGRGRWAPEAAGASRGRR
jgi:UDP-N-acetylmuramoyl-tripeptide--D-alanyl-D-alanine ligase